MPPPASRTIQTLAKWSPSTPPTQLSTTPSMQYNLLHTPNPPYSRFPPPTLTWLHYWRIFHPQCILRTYSSRCPRIPYSIMEWMLLQYKSTYSKPTVWLLSCKRWCTRSFRQTPQTLADLKRGLWRAANPCAPTCTNWLVASTRSMTGWEG
jgi:hypothetical protein